MVATLHIIHSCAAATVYTDNNLKVEVRDKVSREHLCQAVTAAYSIL